MAYWTKNEHAEIRIEQDHFGHISFIVTLDGKQIRANPSTTGSSRSVFNVEAAEKIVWFHVE